MTGRITLVSFLLISLCVANSRGFTAAQQPNPPQPRSAVEQELAAARQAEHAGNLIEAEKIYLAALEEAKQSSDPRLGMVLSNLAGLHFRKQEIAQAISLSEQALAADEKNFGDEHPRVATDLNSLGLYYFTAQKAPEAEKFYKRALEILEKLPERQGSQKIIVLYNLSHVYTAGQRYEESESALKSAIELAEARPHYNPVMLANMRQELAKLARQQGRENDVDILRHDADAGLEPSPTPHGDPIYIALHRAENFRISGRLDEAEAVYQQLIADAEKAGAEKTQRPGYPGYLPPALEGLGKVYVAEHREAEAEDQFKRAIEVCEQYTAPTPEGRAMASHLSFPISLFNLYQKQGRLSDMEPVYDRALAVEERALGPGDAYVGETLVHFAQLYHGEGKDKEALPLYQRALRIKEKNEGETMPLASILREYADALQAAGERDAASAARARAEAIRNRGSVQHETPQSANP